MRMSRGDGRAFTDTAQLFWSTAQLAESEGSSEHFAVRGDGQWHEYRIPVHEAVAGVGSSPGCDWDPCSQSNVQVGLAAIRLIR